MNLYRRLRDSKFWYSPIYYVIMGIVVDSVWSESGSHWGIPHLVWQAGCIFLVFSALRDSVRFVTSGPSPESTA